MDGVPRHIAIIMDGNGRWAKARGLSRSKGHEEGAKSVRATLEACETLNEGKKRVETLSLYAFSTENWRRPQSEVNMLFQLLSRYVNDELEELDSKGIRFRFMGRREGLAKKTLSELDSAMNKTAENDRFQFNVAVNYGSRAEIVDACRAMVRDVQAGRLPADDIDENAIAERLYVPESAELDLLVRTGGELRLSNFMLWQASYAELVVTPVLWPDFRADDLFACVAEYQQRQRNFGGR